MRVEAMMTAWDLSSFAQAPDLRGIILIVLFNGLAGAVFGSMAGLVQWFLLRSRSSAAFPGRMILISTVAGSVAAVARPLVFVGMLLFLFHVIKVLPPQLSLLSALILSIASMGAVYGAIMATASPTLPETGAGSTSEFYRSSLRLPRGW